MHSTITLARGGVGGNVSEMAGQSNKQAEKRRENFNYIGRTLSEFR
jgi:hypothetical protein